MEIGTPTTLANLNPGDRILAIANTPAARVTTGIPWPTDGATQTLTVRTARTFGKSAIVTFTNGGCLTACAANTPCTVAA